MVKGKGIFDVVTNTDECNIVMNAECLEACPYFSLMYLYKHNAMIFFLVFIGLGLFVTFFGEKLFHVVLFLLSTLLVAFVILMFVTQVVLNSNTEAYAYWVVLGVALAAGLTCGYFVYVYEEYCFALVGAFLGGVLGMFLYNLILAKYVPPVFPLYH
jgi:hypothetical protein